MSCYEDFNYIKQAIDNNIAAYILKPLSPAELQEKVDLVIKDIEAGKRAASTKRILTEFMPLVRESLLYRLLYTKNFSMPDDIYKNAQFNEFKNAVIAKYLIFNNGDVFFNEKERPFCITIILNFYLYNLAKQI